MKEDFENINNDLLVKYLLREANHRESVLVEHWIAANASNRKYYEDFKLIWDESRQWTVRGVDEDAAWGRLQNRIHGLPAATPEKAVIARLDWKRVAAIFVLVLAGSWIAFTLLNRGAVQTMAVSAKNQAVSDTLPDGSVVMLNRRSELAYSQQDAANVRSVDLKGEAFFSVSPDSKKPFIIHTNGIRIKVVGTSFNVKTTNGNTEVIVETGIVEVTRRNQSVTLAPKEKITVQAADSSLVKEQVTDQLYNYYRTRQFVCDNTPLWKLAEVLNQAYQVNIVIARRELRSLPLTTVFYDESLESILTVISETFNITVERTANQIILK